MPYRKIFITEQRLKSSINRNKKKLIVLDHIREYMNRVDNSVEIIQELEIVAFHRLLTDLKGDFLSKEEQRMVEEIFSKDINYDLKKLKI